MNAIPPGGVTVAEADQVTSQPYVKFSPKGKARRRNRTRIVCSLALCVGLPTLLALIHYTLIAADQYVAEAKFAVRGTEAAAIDMLGVLTGVPGHAASTGDALIVQDYIRSRDLVEEIGRR